jgi:hypothetical protein
MISRVSIIGIPIFLVGLVLLLLFTVIGVAIGPFIVTGEKIYPQVTIQPSTSETVEIMQGGAEIGTHPLHVIIKAHFIIQYSGDYNCRVSILYVPSEPGSQSEFLRIGVEMDGDNIRNWEQKSLSGTVPPGYASRRYRVNLEIENLGSSDIRIGERLVELRFTLYSTVLPALLAVIGLIVTILGFTVFKGGPAAPRRKVVTPGGWEPTLQWGGGSSSSTEPTSAKRPKMAIKSTKPAKTGQKKVVRKAGPSGGAQQSCKFCGKNVPTSAFFCPHCYGKLR